jgi:hypothetical protein
MALKIISILIQIIPEAIGCGIWRACWQAIEMITEQVVV